MKFKPITVRIPISGEGMEPHVKAARILHVVIGHGLDARRNTIPPSWANVGVAPAIAETDPLSGDIVLSEWAKPPIR
jgi:hypothetical protein